MYYPRTAFMVVTSRCNKRDVCGHCFYNVQPERICETEMEPGEIAAVMKKLRMCGLSTVIFTGGEPLLRGDMPEIISSAGRIGLSTLLLTNGMLLDNDKLDGFRRAGLDGIAMSLARLDEHERRSAATLAAFGRIPFSFIFCFTKSNYNMIPAVTWFAAECGADVIFQPAFIPVGNPLEESLSPRFIAPFEWTRIYMMLQPWARASGRMGYLKILQGLYGGDASAPERCAVSGSALVVDADGTMYPCFHRRDLRCGSARGGEFSSSFAALQESYSNSADAHCFGEHCVSLFTGI